MKNKIGITVVPVVVMATSDEGWSRTVNRQLRIDKEGFFCCQAQWSLWEKGQLAESVCSLISFISLL